MVEASPLNSWSFPGSPQGHPRATPALAERRRRRWLPYLMLVVALLVWGTPPATAQDTDVILTLVADQDPVPAGSTLTYTVTVMNNGAEAATDVMVTSTLDGGLSFVQTDGCIEDPAAVPDCGLGTLAAGAMSSFTVAASVAPDAIGTLTTTAEAATSANDTNPGNNDLALATGISVESDLAVLLSDAPDPVTASQTVTYTAQVVNNGPSDASGVQLTTTPAAGTVIESTVGCSEDPSASPVCTVGDVAAGDTAMVTLEARVGAGTTGDLETLVAVSSTANDTNTANDMATQTTTSVAIADLEVTTSDTPDPVTAGETLTLTVFVENGGPSNATNVVVGTLLPTELTFVSSNGCGNDPMGVPTCELGTIVVGNTHFFQVTATVASDFVGSLDTQFFASSDATDPATGDNQATESTTVLGGADLSVSKTDTVTTAVPGESVTYSIVVANAGPSDVAGAVVSDPFSSVLDCIWQCTPEVGATCSTGQNVGNIDEPIDLPAGLSVTYTAVCQIDSAAVGMLANTVTVTPPAGVPDPDPLDNTASDLDTVLEGRADLRLTKTDGITLTAPGQPVTYTIQVFNDGPSDAPGALVSDTFPSDLENVTWTCTSTPGSSCTGAGTGNLMDTVNLAAGGSLTYLATGTVVAGASGSLTNQGQVDPPMGVFDPNTNNNTDTDFDTQITDQQSDLVVSKTDGTTEAAPGGSVTYTMSVRNDGPQDVVGATATDLFPAELSCIWSCVAEVGASCAVGQVAGDLVDSVDLVVGTTVTYTAVCQIDPAATGSLSNTFTATTPPTVLDPDPEDNTAADLDTVLRGRADLSITKTDGVTSVAPGQPLSYTLVVGNAGPSDVAGATVVDTFPTALEGVTWTCVASAGSSCTPAGVGDLSDVVSLLAGGTLTYTTTGTVATDAAGTLVNSATVTAPEGVDDPNLNDNTAVDFDTAVTDIQADLSISKSDGETSAAPGGSVTYTLAVSNAGPNAVVGATVDDVFPPELDCVWQCVGTDGAQCAAGQVAGDIAQQVNLPVAAVATFTAVCQIDAAATGTLANTATVTAPAGVVDPNPLDNTASDLDTVLSGLADLRISKSDGVTLTAPGQELTYAITVTNDGPSDVVGATVTDTFPSDFENVTWTCLAGAGAACPAGGVGNLMATVDLPAGASLVFQATGTVADAATGTLQNTATVAVPMGVTDPDPSNDSAVDFDTEITNTLADLGITKTDNTTTATPGGPLTYTITVDNAGPAAVTGARVGDVFPSSVDCLWECVASAGAECTAGQVAGNIDHLVNLPVASNVVYTATCTIDGNANGTLANTATISPPAGVLDPNLLDNSAADLDTVLSSPQVDLAITKSDGVANAIPGETLTYTVVVTNSPATLVPRGNPGQRPILALIELAGRVFDPIPENVTGAQVLDTPPSVLACQWTCSALGGATCDPGPIVGNLADTVDIPFGGFLTYTGVCDLAADAAQVLAGATLDNTAQVVAPPGVIDPDPSNDSATDSNTLVPEADLAITKTDGLTSAAPGDPIAYQITVRNLGPSDVDGAVVTDTFPVEIENPVWVCTASLGSACTPAGVGALNDTVILRAGGVLTYLASGTVAASATGTLVNSATVSPPMDVSDPINNNNNALDFDTVLVPVADLAITKTDGLTAAVPGEAVTWVLTVVNAGPSAVTGATVVDDFPTAVSGVAWTCSASAGATCTAAGSGDLSDSVSLPAGGVLTYTATGTLATDAEGTLANTATVAVPAGVVDPDPGDNSASDLDTLVTPRVDLAITKTDGTTTATPGEQITYTVVASNAGPSDALGAKVTDVFPSGTSCLWTCVGANGGVCTPGQVAGNIDDTVNLPAGSMVTYTAVCALDSSATGTLENTATVTPPGGVVELQPSDNSASDLDTVLVPTVDLTASKSDGLTSAAPGETITYTLVLGNLGPSDAVGAAVSDVFPGELENVVWGCVGSGGASCVSSGVGDLDQSVDLPVGGTVTYTADATVRSDANGTLSNTVTVTAASGSIETNAADNTATDADTVLVPRADLAITKSDGVTTATPGEMVTYTIVVSNAGPSATEATVADAFSSELSCTWTCVGSLGGLCAPGPVSGDVADAVTLPAGSTATYTASCAIANGAVGSPPNGSLANTATVTAAAGTTDPDLANNTASDLDTVLMRQADLQVTKSDGRTTAVPGDTLTYTIVASNPVGPSDVAGATVSDVFPAFLDCSWSCVAAGGGVCATGPVQGDLVDTVDLPVGATATYTASCAIDVAAVGTLVNTATIAPPIGVVDPQPGNDSATDADTVLEVEADLTVSKTDGVTLAIPGQSVTYTVVVGNNGPNPIFGARVVDDFPTELDCVWGCVASPGAVCTPGQVAGNIDDLTNLPVGATATYTATCQIDPGATGTLSNTATVAPPLGATDPVSANDSASDLDTVLAPEADLRITKTDGLTSATPGETLTYTVEVRNPLGPSAIADAQVVDTPPASLDCSWTCVGSGGASCTPGPTVGDLDDLVTVPVGGIATYTGSCVIDPLATGTLTNTATVTVPVGATDTDPSNDSATDDDTVLVPQVDVQVALDDGTATAIPGTTTTYSLVVSNPVTLFVVGPTDDDRDSLLYRVDWAEGRAARVTEIGTLGVAGCRRLAVDAGTLWTLCGESFEALDAGQGEALALSTRDGRIGHRLPLVDSVFERTRERHYPFGLHKFVSLGDPTTHGLWGLGASREPAGTPGSLGRQVLDRDEGTDADGDGGLDWEEIVELPTTPRDLAVWNGAPDKSVFGALVRDLFPASLDCTWTCAAAGGATCTPGPVNGDVLDTIDLPVGAVVDYTASCAIDPAATGTLVNTADVVLPGDVVDSDPSNNADSDTDTLVPTADLVLSKTDGVTTAVPGGSLTYTIVASNPSGPSTVRGLGVSDVFPGVLSCVWGCAQSGGATCTPGQVAGDIHDTLDLPVGAVATYTATCQIDPAAFGTLQNVASIALPADVVDSDLNNNTAADLDTLLTPLADLLITKTDGVTSARPGDPLTYTVTVRHLGGTSSVVGAQVEDVPPTGVDCLWTCAPFLGASCAPGQIAGSLFDVVDLPLGSRVVYTGACTIDSNATGTLVNTASVTMPPGGTDLNPLNDLATDADTVLEPATDLRISKSNGVDTVVPLEAVTYTVVASNPGPSDAPATTVTDVFPAELEGCTWTCQRAGGATCTQGPVAGDLADTFDLPVAATATYTIDCTVTADAEGQLINSATIAAGPDVVELDPGNDTATDLDTVFLLEADLLIFKTDGVESVAPGGTVVYTVTVGNPVGPDAIEGALVEDTPPAELDCLWTCAAQNGATCSEDPIAGDLAELVDLPVGGLVVFTGTCAIDADAGSPDGTTVLTNTATVSVPVGASDPDPSNNTASDSDTVLVPDADLLIFKTDGSTTAFPGDSLTYTISIDNPGPSDLASATVTDDLPAVLSCTWTCAAAEGASCTTAPPAGDLADTVVLPVGGSLLYTATCTLDPAATGTLSNTVTVSWPTSSRSGSDTSTLVPAADLSITKTNGANGTTPGATTVYTITASNTTGPSSVSSRVQDFFPSTLDCSWTCAPTGAASCFAGPQSGDVDQVVTLPVGTTVVYTATCTVDPGATGSISNTATVAPPTGGVDFDLGNNVSTDVDPLGFEHDLDLAKSGSPGSVVPGESVTYTLAVENLGPSDARGVTVVDTLPEGMTYVSSSASGFTTIVDPPGEEVVFDDGFESGDTSRWTAARGAKEGSSVPEGGEPCTASGSVVTCTPGDLLAGSTGVVTLVARVEAGTAAGDLINSATVSADGGDPNAANDTATATTTLGVGDTDMGLVMNDVPDPVAAGGTLTYDLVVTNHGPAIATGVTVTDNLPPETTFQFANTSQGSCSNDVGVVTCAVGTVIAGASAQISLVVLVAEDATAALTNPAVVAADQVDPNPINDVDTETTTVLGKSLPLDPEGDIPEIPVLHPWALTLLAAWLALVAWRRIGGRS